MYPIWPIFVTPVPPWNVSPPPCAYIYEPRTHTHNYNLNRDQQAYDCATVCVYVLPTRPRLHSVSIFDKRWGPAELCYASWLCRLVEIAKRLSSICFLLCVASFSSIGCCTDAWYSAFLVLLRQIDSPVTWLFAKLVTSPSIDAYWFCSISGPALFNTHVRCLASPNG